MGCPERSHFVVFAVFGLFMCFQGTQQQGIDQMIIAASEDAAVFDTLFDLSGNTVRLELDMLLNRQQYNALQGSNRKKRKAIKAEQYRWKDKTIPYKIDSDFRAADVDQIKRAIQEWSDYTCLHFKVASRSDNNRIYFTNGKGCYSYVGMVGGSQKIGLARGCRYKGVITHEIGHAVGFHHEQNRPDRDRYVTIMRANIPTSLYNNFKKYPYSAVSTFYVPYDYGSIMHYGGTAFSTNGKYTIRTNDPKDQRKIGNRKGLSFNDIQLANLMYKCNENCESNIRCPNAGFVAKDCKCWCPGTPIQRCGKTDSSSTATPGKVTTNPPEDTTPTYECRDMNRNCGHWAKANYCDRNSYVKTYCKVSCNLCSGAGTEKPSCKDSNKNCVAWGKNGFCEGKFEDFMNENCAQTCKICNRESNPVEGGGAALRSGLGVLVAATVLAWKTDVVC